jgi:Phosphotransferase system, HPr-related proteins
METAKIKLQATDDVRDFVRAASKCDFDVDVFYNRIIVDAKSLLGVLSLDLNQNLSVSCRGYDPMFEHTLKKYAVA